ncbi:unnamed protein product [Moneuplotes crassus]|uniref:Uncharacterized protein n=1 Tax=Euplotes crassus TaxID=5936 RepID=A0AAD2D8T2_EUPCR|nr:unnamed protein product [Moneuplotes crassus]
MSILTGEYANSGSGSRSLPQANHSIISLRGSCICGCIRRPPWVIPSISGVVNKVDNSEKMVVQKIDLDATIYNSIAEVKLSQQFKNTTGRPIECVYQFPLNEEFIVNGVKATIGDKTVETQIMMKEKAAEKYDDSVAQGNTAIRLEYDEENQKALVLNIGQLQKNQEVQIDIRISTKCNSFKHGQYAFVFPVNFLPAFMQMQDNQFKIIKPKFSCRILLKCDSEVTNLNTSHEEFSHSVVKDGNLLEFSDLESVGRKDIMLSYSYEDIRQLNLKFYSSSKHPDEVVGHLSGLPRISPEVNEEGKAEEMVLKDPDGSNDDPEIATGEFIFLIDRSFSMTGQRISIAKDALRLFIRSLPEGSKFNIVSFGTRYTLFKEESIEYNEESLNEAIDEINTFTADLGGTEILTPLCEIFKMKPTPGYPRNIFLLTDGAVQDKEKVIRKISENSSKARVHSFGIGHSVDKYLVKESARSGKGSYSFTTEHDSDLNSKVITSLKDSLRPSMTNITIDWNSLADAFKYPSSVSLYSSYEDTYEEEPIHLFVIFSKPLLDQILKTKPSCVTVSYYQFEGGKVKTLSLPIYSCSPPLTTHSHPVSFKAQQLGAEEADCEETQNKEAKVTLEEVPQNPPAFTLASQHLLQHISPLPSSDLSSTKISLKYNTLCSTTTFFGKLKTPHTTGESPALLTITPKSYCSIQSIYCQLPYTTSGYRRGSVPLTGYRGGRGSGRGGRGRGLSVTGHGEERRSRGARGRGVGFGQSGRRMGGLERNRGVEMEVGSGDMGLKERDNRDKMKRRRNKCRDSQDKCQSKSGLGASIDINPETRNKILSLQAANGSFKSLASFIKPPSQPSELSNLDLSKKDITLLWTTITSLAYLSKYFGASRKEWSLIYKKGIRFCEGVLKGEVGVEEIVREVVKQVR